VTYPPNRWRVQHWWPSTADCVSQAAELPYPPRSLECEDWFVTLSKPSSGNLFDDAYRSATGAPRKRSKPKPKVQGQSGAEPKPTRSGGTAKPRKRRNFGTGKRTTKVYRGVPTQQRKKKSKKQQAKKKPKPPKYRLRKARGQGTCPRCGQPYRKGDMLGGETGNWFHERHLSPEAKKAAWSARVANQTNPRPMRGGGWETNRSRH
jgi:hypothetical protein